MICVLYIALLCLHICNQEFPSNNPNSSISLAIAAKCQSSLFPSQSIHIYRLLSNSTVASENDLRMRREADLAVFNYHK